MKYNVNKITKKDLAWIDWTAADMKKQVDTAVQRKKMLYAKLKLIPAKERTFENTIFPLENDAAQLLDLFMILEFISHVSPKEKQRTLAFKNSTALENTLVDIEFDPEMYEVVLEYKRNREKINEEEKRLVDEYIRGYKRMGFALPKSKQKELKKIIKDISKLSAKFQHNINAYHDFILVTEKQLAGLPKSYISRLQKDKKTGKYQVSLAYPEFHPFMRLADSETKRKELGYKSRRKGGKKNVSVITKIIELRKEKAKLLGYKTHADFVTEERMVGSGSKALAFLLDMAPEMARGAKQDIKMLAKRKKQDTKKPFELHDVAYYSNKLSKELFEIDSEEIKEYFPLEHVKAQMINLYSDLFGLTFKKKNLKLWHKDAELYEIYVDGDLSGYIGMDLHPRKGKYGHAAVIGWQSGRKLTYSKKDKTYNADKCILVCNFPKSSKNNPSLLSMGEVVTLFHECGHALHHAVTKARFSSHSGTSVKRDFVEAPSQILENWVKEPRVLQKISSHYKTGEPLPQEMIDKMKAASGFMKKYGTARQMTFGLFDLYVHTKKISDHQKLYVDVTKKLTGLTPDIRGYMSAGFGHLVGYDAGYYGYLWALVYADDMYTRFKKEGVLSKKVGKSFRKEVLEVGSSREEIDSVKAFLGRKPNNKAFLKNLGL